MKAFPTNDPKHFGESDAEGMDLRDYFADSAMNAIVSALYQDESFGGWTQENIATEAYQLADAMMEARKQ